MNQRSLQHGFFILFLVFFIGLGLNLLAVWISGVFSSKVVLYLSAATFLSFILTVVLLGGYFTNLAHFLIQLRRLVKLTNLTHPLLLQLSSNAPGTYHHSILVANLAVKAARTIGADSVLCRVGGYFHDIGKLNNPTLYIENQNTSSLNQNENNHPEDIDKKVEMIKEHVTKGITLAKEYHLPPEVINLIAQHHGTSLCGSFYELAKETKKKRLKESLFRYPGPKPQTKEAAIVMLADALEAKTRVKDCANHLEELIEETFQEKIQDGQLDESSLSKKDIVKLKEGFLEALQGMTHQRVEYRSR